MNTRIDTWFERDRQYVGLIDHDTDQAILEFWDEDVTQAIEDGFINVNRLHLSMRDYAIELGLLDGSLD